MTFFLLQITCFFPIFKAFITKSLKGSKTHNIAYVVCSSHLVILLLKHLIRGRNLLPLSVSRCARSSLSSLAGDEKKHLSMLSVSTRPSTTHRPRCSFFLAAYAANTKTEISLTSLAGRCSRTLFKHTHRSLLSRHSTSCHRQLLSSSRLTSTLHL